MLFILFALLLGGSLDGDVSQSPFVQHFHPDQDVLTSAGQMDTEGMDMNGYHKMILNDFEGPLHLASPSV